MALTLREAAQRLTAIATDVREVAGSLDGTDEVRNGLARDLRVTAYTLDRFALKAERAGVYVGEPDAARVVGR